MLQYHGMADQMSKFGMLEWADAAMLKANSFFSNINHGDYDVWYEAMKQLPEAIPSNTDFSSDIVQVGEIGDLCEKHREQLIQTLKKLMPWRKGPFRIFGIELDSEWRSDMKWKRISKHISSLEQRSVLDVGCGNGYYGWRMLGEGASVVVGVDPTLRFAMQFQLVKQYLSDQPFYFLPFAVQDLPLQGARFDTVFSMGVIYHRRDPIEHCRQLNEYLRPNGELVLETLIVEDRETLIPDGRYAKMNNVWHIPNTEDLMTWLNQSGFINLRLVDTSRTTTQEQRGTAWMTFESLADFLDPTDHLKTIEGLPAPVRATVVAEKP